MKYHSELLINLPRSQVVDLFKDPENLHHWQPDLISFDAGFDAHERSGAQAKLTYQKTYFQEELLETVLENHLPDSFSIRYETDGLDYIQDNYFEPISDSQTLWVSKNDYHPSGWKRFMALLNPDSLKEQDRQHMLQFKEYAENEGKDIA